MLIIKDRAHMSIGRSFSIKVRSCVRWIHLWNEGCDKACDQWRSGNGYNYGMLPPRYPVPAPILDVEWSSTKGPHVWKLFQGNIKPTWACVIPSNYYWG